MYYQHFSDGFGMDITADVHIPQLLIELAIPEEK